MDTPVNTSGMTLDEIREAQRAGFELAADDEAEARRQFEALHTFPDGLPRQLDDRGSDSWCGHHKRRIPWAADGICGACEFEGEFDEPEADEAQGYEEPFCACGRRWSDCDGSRTNCHRYQPPTDDECLF